LFGLYFLEGGDVNLGSLQNEATQVAPAPGPQGQNTLILAANRTNRPDVLRGFHRYHGGWDISDRHYWAVSAIMVPLFITIFLEWMNGLLCFYLFRTNSIVICKI
jgi:hypothetical protein